MPTILITGAGGFVGQLLATHLLSSSTNKVVLTDIFEPTVSPKAAHPECARCIKADLCDSASLASLLEAAGRIDTIFIFHGIMSSGSENDFPLGLRVNLHSTLSLLEALRTTSSIKPENKLIRVIYASSLAVYGRPLPAKISEQTHPTPEGSYGAQKLACETMIQDYTRKGYIDALCLRFPTISVRPGKPTQAASSFLSGMIREPMAGQECIIPIVDRDFRSWMCSPRTLVENLCIGMEMDLSGVDKHRRVVNLPGEGASVQEMMDALVKVGGEEKLKLIREESDEGMERMLRSWGTEYDNTFAFKLGFKPDKGFEQAVKDYAEGLQ